MSGPSSDIVDRMLRGEASGFDDVVAWYSEDVLRLCYLMLRDREEALDAFQDVMFRFVERVRSGRFQSRDGSIKGFLLTCARNLCIDRLRGRKNFLSFVEDVPSGEPSLRNTRTPDRVADEARLQAAFLDALSQLTDSQRTVLVLFDVKGDSYKEIAEALDISIGKVKTDLHRARRKLRRILEPFEDER